MSHTNDNFETASVAGIMSEKSPATIMETPSRPRSVSAAPRIVPLDGSDTTKSKDIPMSRVSISQDPKIDFMDKQHAYEYGRTKDAYSLIREIGKGKGSTVWFASAKLPNKRQPVAIKRFDLEGNHWNNKKLSVNHLDNLITEVNNMKACEHPNIASLLSVFVNEMELWIVIELCDAGSVLDLLHDTGQDDGLEEEDLIATVLFDVLKALKYIHEQHIIHRDLKASNILINSEGEVKITDFGYSGVLLDGGQVKYQTSSFIGSTHWMAPEVMQQNGSYSYAADIWSFGITALEIANGKTPTDDDTNLKLYVKVINEPAPALEDTPFRKFSVQFKDMISQCLNKDPMKRPTAAKLMSHPFFKKAKTPAYIKEKLVDHSQTIEKRGVSMRSSLKLLRPPEEDKNSSSNSITEWIFDFNKEMVHHQNDDSKTTTNNNNKKNSTKKHPKKQDNKKKKPKHPALYLDFQVDGVIVPRPVVKKGTRYSYVNRNGNTNYATEKKKLQIYYYDDQKQRVYLFAKATPSKLTNSSSTNPSEPSSTTTQQNHNESFSSSSSDNGVPLSSSIATSGTGRKFKVEDASLQEIMEINQRKPNPIKPDKMTKMYELLQSIQQDLQQSPAQHQRYMYLDLPNEARSRVYRGKKPTSMYRFDNNTKVRLRDDECDQVYYDVKPSNQDVEVQQLLRYIDSLENRIDSLSSQLKRSKNEEIIPSSDDVIDSQQPIRRPPLEESSTTTTTTTTDFNRRQSTKSSEVPKMIPDDLVIDEDLSPSKLKPLVSSPRVPKKNQRVFVKPADAFADVDDAVKNMFDH